MSLQFLKNSVNIETHRKWEKEKAILLKCPHLFLSSFPRSGNGWVRLVMAALVLESKGIDVNRIKLKQKSTNKGVEYIVLEADYLNYSLEDLFPDIYILKPETYDTTIGEDVKSLNLPVQLIKTHYVVDCSLSKAIFLFREPLPCLTSASLLLKPEFLDKNPSKINETIVDFAKIYNQMLESYLKQKTAHPDRCLFLSHSAISGSQPVSHFLKTMSFLGIPIKLNSVEKVLRKFPFKTGFDKTFKKYVSDNTKEVVESLLRENYNHAVEISLQD